MSNFGNIEDLIGLIDKQAHRPLAIYEAGTVTYIISGLITIGDVSGYPVLRSTSPTASHTYLDKGFLLESNRVSGSNGSAAGVDLKEDAVNTLLLLSDPTIDYA